MFLLKYGSLSTLKSRLTKHGKFVLQVILAQLSRILMCFGIVLFALDLMPKFLVLISFGDNFEILSFVEAAER